MSRRAMWGLWAIVILELVVPIPTILTFGIAWVLLTRPEGFYRLVSRLYGREPVPAPAGLPREPGGTA